METSPQSHPLRPAILAYVLVWVLGAAWALLSEFEVVPTEYLSSAPDVQYAISIATILTAIGGTFLALRLMAIARVKRSIAEAADEAARLKRYRQWALVRIGILAVAVWTNVVLYYASSYATSTRYCLLIALIAAVFCCPSKGEWEKMQPAEPTEP